MLDGCPLCDPSEPVGLAAGAETIPILLPMLEGCPLCGPAEPVGLAAGPEVTVDPRYGPGLAQAATSMPATSVIYSFISFPPS
jgi:hypothetical protein